MAKIEKIKVYGEVKNDTYRVRIISNAEHTSATANKGIKLETEIIVKCDGNKEMVIEKTIYLMNSSSFNRFADAVAIIENDYLTTDEVLTKALDGFEMLVTFKNGMVYSWKGDPLPDDADN